MKKKLCSTLLALLMMLSLLPTASLAADDLTDVPDYLGEPVEEDWLEPEEMPVSLSELETYASAPLETRTGSLSINPLTRQEIRDLLASAPLTGTSFSYQPAGVFVVNPSLSTPFSPGKVTDAALNEALDRLNALRALAGLPSVTLDATMNEDAQYGALAIAYLGKLTHYPAQGDTASKFSELPSNIQQRAAEATRASNLYAGRNLTWSMDGFMDDSDSTNIKALGHRRWQLNPVMGKVGFGYVTTSTSYRQYVAEMAHDTSASSAKNNNYNCIAWPASGNFPNNLNAFKRTTAWSVTLNPSRYSTPNLDSVEVTLTGGGKTWHFSQNSSDGYFNINNEGYGVSNCIIFRPDGTEKFEGDYTVVISGLKDRSNKSTSLSYTVTFFDASAAPGPTYRLWVKNGYAPNIVPLSYDIESGAYAYEIEAGETVDLVGLSGIPDTEFQGWSSTSGSDFRILGDNTASFTMPNRDVEVTAVFAWNEYPDALHILARYDGDTGKLIKAVPGKTGGEVFFDGMTFTWGDKIFVLDPETKAPLREPITVT